LTANFLPKTSFRTKVAIFYVGPTRREIHVVYLWRTELPGNRVRTPYQNGYPRQIQKVRPRRGVSPAGYILHGRKGRV
jgi:hypothetical protein